MLFLKEHLKSDYQWGNESDNSVYTGSPSRRAFDRYNGDQMLFLINLYGSLSQKITINEGRKMESLLLNHLPLEAKSEVSAFNWLRENFNLIPEEKVNFINNEL